MIEKVKDDVAEILAPSTEYLVEKRFTPDLLTMIGFVFNIGAAVLFGFGLYMWAGLTVLVAGIFDFLDGQVARKGKTESQIWCTLSIPLLIDIPKFSSGLALRSVLYGLMISGQARRSFLHWQDL